MLLTVYSYSFSRQMGERKSLRHDFDCQRIDAICCIYSAYMAFQTFDNAAKFPRWIGSIERENLAFGRAVRTLRKAKYISQQQLGDRAELDRSYVSLLELGRCSPTLIAIMKLCRALDCTFTELAARVDSILDEESAKDRKP